MKQLLLGIMLLFSTSTHADPLETYDYLIITADYLQTRDTMTNPNFREVNPLYGDSIASLNRATIGVYALHFYINKTQYRNEWNIMLGIVKTLAVIHNHHIGVRFKF